MYGRQERCTQGLMGRPEEKRPLGRPSHRREENIKMDLQRSGIQMHGLDLSGSG